MNADKILEKWNEQFSNVEELKIDDVKNLYKKIDETDNTELKKSYYDKIILGTQHVVYNYLTSTNIYSFSSVEIGTEDIIATAYETWIEKIKAGELREANFFSEVTRKHTFDFSVEKKLGVVQQFKPLDSKFYESRKQFSETVLGNLNDKDLRKSFIEYYRLRQSDDKQTDNVKSCLDNYNISDRQKLKLVDFYEQVSKYLNSSIGNNKISDTNLGKYIKLIISNTIAENFSKNLNFADSREIDSDVIKNDMREKIFNLFQDAHLTNCEEFIIRNRFGLEDDCPKTLEKVGESIDANRERVRQIESKALRKLRGYSGVKKLKNFL